MKITKFYATWCGPCKALDEAISRIEHSHEITSVDIESEEGRKLVKQYDIRGVPTMIKFNDDGSVNLTKVGQMGRSALASFLE